MSDWPWDLRFEVAFDVNPGDEPIEADWSDLSDRLSSADGRTVTVTHAPADSPGTAELTLNNRDRELDPTNMPEQMTWGGVAMTWGGEPMYWGSSGPTYNLVPMRHARLGVVVGATTYPLFRGFVEDWRPVWSEYNQGLVDVTLLHPLNHIAPLSADVDLPAQRSGERITAVLDLAGWSATRRDIATGTVWMEPFGQESANLLSLLHDTREAEDGLLHVDPAGDVVFRDRHYLFSTDATIQFGPDGHKVAADPGARNAPTVNIGRAEMADGTVYEYRDTTSVDEFGEKPWSVRDLPLPTVQAKALTSWTVNRFSDPPNWELDTLKVHGHGRNVDLAGLLNLRLGHLGDFGHIPPGGGTVELSGSVATIEHVIGKGEWNVTAPLKSWHGEGPWLEWGGADSKWDGTRRWAP